MPWLTNHGVSPCVVCADFEASPPPSPSPLPERPRHRPNHHPQRFLRSDPRALQGLRRGVRGLLEAADRRDADHQAVAWRLGHAGPRGDRRARRRRRDARRSRATSTPSPRPARSPGLEDPPPERVRALHLDHRVPGARRQSQGHQGLGRSGQAGRRRSSRPTRRPPAARAGTISRPGPTPTQKNGDDQAKAKDFVADALQERAGARYRRARLDHDLRPARHRRRAARWENEAFLALKELGADKFEIVVPSLSILAEPPVAVVDGNVDKKGTRKVAEAYLNYLYSDAGPEDHRQELLPAVQPRGRRSGRPQALSRAQARDDRDPLFGGWAKVQPTHFADGGIFDQIYQPTQLIAPLDERRFLPRSQEAERHPGLRADARLHARLSRPDRAHPARRAGAALGGARAGPTSGGSRPTRAPSRRCKRQLRRSRSLAAAINAVFGLIVAWVLVRYRFPGPALLDAIVDLPFALPTAVAGIALTALYAPNGWIGSLAGAARHQDRLHAARHRDRADLHRPAVRGAHGAAGARGARPRGRGGGRHARRARASRPSRA